MLCRIFATANGTVKRFFRGRELVIHKAPADETRFVEFDVGTNSGLVAALQAGLNGWTIDGGGSLFRQGILWTINPHGPEEAERRDMREQYQLALNHLEQIATGTFLDPTAQVALRRLARIQMLMLKLVRRRLTDS